MLKVILAKIGINLFRYLPLEQIVAAVQGGLDGAELLVLARQVGDVGGDGLCHEGQEFLGIAGTFLLGHCAELSKCVWS